MSMASDSMPMSTMEMTFYTSTTTPLFSRTWSPKNNGSYAGTCIFLVVLAIILRSMMAGKALMERRWRDQQPQRKLILECELPMEAGRLDTDIEGNHALLVSPRGVEKDVKVVTNKAPRSTSFRLSVDLPRATYVTTMAAVGYLLSVAVSLFSDLETQSSKSDSRI